MTKKQKAEKIIEILKDIYPKVQCALEFTKPHELLIATRLSAQCTDKRVNLVTPALFEKFPTIDSFAQSDENIIGEYIHSCGLYKTKAHDIAEMCRMLKNDYNGTIPDTIEELVKLPGVGRKTANLVVGELYGKPAFVTDTHVIRLSGRLGLTGSKEPLKVEKDLRAIVDENEGLGLCHRLVWHGRLTCMARNPQCSTCSLKELCIYYKKEYDKK